ncbi:response regulator transcription factor [bacterium]|nr:response regulator transcription factor [bacterium]MDC3259965.1 response regulator transcription factor [bacterium]
MTEKIKVLLVEDDPNLGTILSEYLNVKGYDTTLAVDGEKGYDEFIKNNFEFIILDVMMPKKDGFTLATDIRNTNKDIPIIFLTAKSLKEDTIEGFRLGADDYITKPFSMEELMARMNAILRRVDAKHQENSQQKEFSIGKFTFHAEKRMLKSEGEEDQKLTSKESELLRLLCLNKNKVMDRTFALKAIWNDDSYFNSRSMDVYITKLRKYLKSDSAIEILNVHGQGFRLSDS